MLKERLRNGEQLYGTWLSVCNAGVGELLARVGFDFVVVDAEHGAIDLGAAEDLVRAIQSTGTTPLVRIPWNDQALVKRALDLGPEGLIIPMVSTPEAARAAGRYAKYAPEGVRGVGVSRAQQYGLDLVGYLERANREGMIAVQIEDGQAVANVAGIIEAPGVDMVFVGPFDLASALGYPAQPNHPAVEEAVGKVLAAARQAGKLAGIHAPDAATAKRRREQGFNIVTVGADVVFLTQGARAVLSQLS